MGENGATTDHGVHLDTCAQCRDDVDQVAAVVATARATTRQVQPQASPDTVWERVLNGIAAQNGTETSPAGTPLADVVSLRPRGPHPALLAAAAALVGILAGAGATYAVTRNPPHRKP